MNLSLKNIWKTRNDIARHYREQRLLERIGSTCMTESSRTTNTWRDQKIVKNYTNKTCDRSACTSGFVSVLVCSSLRVDVFVLEVVSWEMRPAGGRLFGQVDVDSDTVALTAAVIQTFLHWLCRLVLTRTHWILILKHLPLRAVALRRCIRTVEVIFFSHTP